MIRFNAMDSLADFDLYYSHSEIEFPTAQTSFVSVPGRDGSIDLSEYLTGTVNYNDRHISMTFYTKKLMNEWPAMVAKIGRYLHGKRLQIFMPKDAYHFYLGRISVDGIIPDGNLGRVNITATCEPYRWEVGTSRETLNSILVEDGTIKKVTLTAAGDGTATYDGETFTLVQGDNELPIIFRPGTHSITVSGTTATAYSRIGVL